MKHFANHDFWQNYNALPAEVRAIADKAYALLSAAPLHPSLHFKKTKSGIWSARVGVLMPNMTTF